MTGTPRGKGPRASGPPTEELPPLVVHAEFTSEHRCRSMPTHVRLLQSVPMGWRISGPRYLVIGIAYCSWCGVELVKEGVGP